MCSVSIEGNRGSGIYPERPEPRVEWLDRLAASAAGMLAPWVRPRAHRFRWILDQVGNQGRTLQGVSDPQLRDISGRLRQRLRKEGYQKELVGQAFALVREAAERTIGMSHFDVQLIGGLVLLKGMIAEMETGEGKTLVATLPACTAAFAGIPVHIITVNDYLAERDSRWMGPIYRALGLTVGAIIHGMSPQARRAAYQCDVT
jgi:preprotein translocase subunit SecA